MKKPDLPASHRLCSLSHIGTLNPSDKKSLSQEGSGLSVSMDPQAWREIARLGDASEWLLDGPGSAKFVDAHELTHKHRKALIAWGKDQGLVAEHKGFLVRREDSESGEEITFEFLSEDAALAEMDEDCSIEGRQILVATDQLTKRVKQDIPSALAFDILLTVYAEESFEDLGIHGVWWDDEHGPLSAPRGVIHLRALPSWDATPADTPSAKDRG